MKPIPVTTTHDPPNHNIDNKNVAINEEEEDNNVNDVNIGTVSDLEAVGVTNTSTISTISSPLIIKEDDAAVEIINWCDYDIPVSEPIVLETHTAPLKLASHMGLLLAHPCQRNYNDSISKLDITSETLHTLQERLKVLKLKGK